VKKPIPFGKYYLLERINVGGMAEVFRAKAYGVEGFERLVAVKRILPNIAEDKEFISMFIDEAKIAVQLNHANIAQIFDLGMVEQAYYIALEHIHGRDLRNIFDRCRNNGAPMPIAQACFVVMKVCEGLDYAHNKRDQSGRELNLVHRDVSPQNILVSFEGEVKLIDFGIAKAAGKGSKTQAGILKGKFGYMSPEQVRGLPIDRRSDIFACGICLYELLTGERLFVGESDFSTLEKVRNVEILPPSTYNRKIPDELERIVLKALAKDDEDRYQNAIDLHDELQAFVYTAGEFYSRKDLAAWMKRGFAREIEEETAKLEAYRRLRPPEAGRAGTAPPAGPDGRRSTLALPSVAKPPPPPPVPVGGRASSQMHAAAPQQLAASDGLEWDDDELETQIYDNIEDQLHAPGGMGRPGAGAPVMLGAGGVAAAAAAGPDQPDLSSLVQTARGWDSAPAQQVAPPQVDPPAPDSFANGSNQAPSPFAPEPRVPIEPGSAAPSATESSAVARLIDIAEPIFDSAGAQAMPPMQRRSRTGLYIGIAAAIVLLAGGITAAVIIGSGGGDEVASNDTAGEAAAG
jgi:serine/threonine protein kinase